MVWSVPWLVPLLEDIQHHPVVPCRRCIIRTRLHRPSIPPITQRITNCLSRCELEQKVYRLSFWNFLQVLTTENLFSSISERSWTWIDRVPSSSQSGRRSWRTDAVTAFVFPAGSHAGHNTTAYIPVGNAKQSIGNDAEQSSTSDVKRFATAAIQQMERHESITACISGIFATFPVRNVPYIL